MLKTDEGAGRGGTALIRRTKVVATLGPATGTPEGIAGLIAAGANVIRVNSSHGTPELRASWIAAVRAAAAAADVAVAVLVDLQGPRIRVGNLAAPRVLRAGETVVFAPEEVARGDELPTTYADLATDVRPGARILLDDGLLSLEVTRIVAPRVEGRVVDGGTLTAHKGMNLPGLHVSAPALTEKDREDTAQEVRAGAGHGGLSCVRGWEGTPAGRCGRWTASSERWSDRARAWDRRPGTSVGSPPARPSPWRMQSRSARARWRGCSRRRSSSRSPRVGSPPAKSRRSAPRCRSSP